MEHSENLNSQKDNRSPKLANSYQNTEKLTKNPKQDPKKVDKPEKILKYFDVNFKFDQITIDRLLFKKLETKFVEDLITFLSVPRGRLVNDVMKDFFKTEKNIEDAAHHCHSILEDLTIKWKQPPVPRKIIFSFLKVMLQNRKKIIKLLDKKAGDKLLDQIPLEYLIDIVQLFDLKLSRKDASIFFKELAESSSFIGVPRFIKLTGYDFEQELIPVIQRLIAEKQYKTLRTIPNLKKMFSENKVLIKQKANMLRGTANYHFRAEGWEYLEEIFQYHPHVIANILNSNFGINSSKFQKDEKYLEGVVSICQRNPQVSGRLKPDTKKVIKEKRQEMVNNGKSFPQNFLRINYFKPSSNEYFSFEEFGKTQEHVIWIDDKMEVQKLKSAKEKILKEERISIDTQSTLVRTPIDLDRDVLSLIQVSTPNQVFLFDPYNSKHPQIKAIFQDFFCDKNKMILGHTIQDDVEGIANFFDLPRPVCKILDIKEEYQKFLNSNKQFGLKTISKEILGKEICKKYTMTNWDRRPLNKCQIHYGAMDAFVIFKIWDKLSELIQDKKTNPAKYKKTQAQKQTKKSQQNQDEQKKPDHTEEETAQLQIPEQKTCTA